MLTEGKCIHFNGTANKTCKAGVKYGDVSVERPYGSIPCFEKNKLKTCREFQLPTSEQIAQQKEELAAHINNIGIARAAITGEIRERGMEGRNVTGKIKCPVCESGEISFSCAGAYNGHIHARCSTPECVDWME